MSELSDPLHNDSIEKVGLTQSESGVTEFLVGECGHEDIVDSTGSRSVPQDMSRNTLTAMRISEITNFTRIMTSCRMLKYIIS